MSFTVSSANDEKVVNPPRNPAIINGLTHFAGVA